MRVSCRLLLLRYLTWAALRQGLQLCQLQTDATLPIGHPPTTGRQPKAFHGQKSIWLQNDLHHVVNYSSRHLTFQRNQPIIPRPVPSQSTRRPVERAQRVQSNLDRNRDEPASQSFESVAVV